MLAAESDQAERVLQPRLPKPRHVGVTRGGLETKMPGKSPGTKTSHQSNSKNSPADMDLVEQRGGDGGHLFAVGGAGDSDAGLVEDALDAGCALQIVEQLGDQHAVLALGVIDDLAGRG